MQVVADDSNQKYDQKVYEGVNHPLPLPPPPFPVKFDFMNSGTSSIFQLDGISILPTTHFFLTSFVFSS